MCLIARTALPVVDRKPLRMLLCRQTPGRGRRVLLRSLLPARGGGSGQEELPQRRVCLSHEKPGAGGVGKPAASRCLNAARLMAGAAEQLPRVRSPEVHSFAAELC